MLSQVICTQGCNGCPCPEAPATGGERLTEAEALDCGCVVETLLCCTVTWLTIATAADKLATGSN